MSGLQLAISFPVVAIPAPRPGRCAVSPVGPAPLRRKCGAGSPDSGRSGCGQGNQCKNHAMSVSRRRVGRNHGKCAALRNQGSDLPHRKTDFRLNASMPATMYVYFLSRVTRKGAVREAAPRMEHGFILNFYHRFMRRHRHLRPWHVDCMQLPRNPGSSKAAPSHHSGRPPWPESWSISGKSARAPVERPAPDAALPWAAAGLNARNQRVGRWDRGKR